MKNIKSLIFILLPVVIILLLVILKSLNTNSFKLSAKEAHELSLNQDITIGLDELKAKPKDSIQIFDLSAKEQYEKNHLPGAINIQFEIIVDNFSNYFDENKTSIIYSESIAKTTEAWIILTQMGYQNLYILDVPGEFISKGAFDKDSQLIGSEVLRYNFQPDTTIRLEK